MVFPSLKPSHVKLGGLPTAQAAAQQDRQQGSVSFPFNESGLGA
jgi:hypothetical protein